MTQAFNLPLRSLLSVGVLAVSGFATSDVNAQPACGPRGGFNAAPVVVVNNGFGHNGYSRIDRGFSRGGHAGFNSGFNRGYNNRGYSNHGYINRGHSNGFRGGVGFSSGFAVQSGNTSLFIGTSRAPVQTFHRGSRFGHRGYTPGVGFHRGASQSFNRGFDRGFDRGFATGFDRGFRRGVDRGPSRRGVSSTQYSFRSSGCR